MQEPPITNPEHSIPGLTTQDIVTHSEGGGGGGERGLPTLLQPSNLLARRTPSPLGKSRLAVITTPTPPDSRHKSLTTPGPTTAPLYILPTPSQPSLQLTAPLVHANTTETVVEAKMHPNVISLLQKQQDSSSSFDFTATAPLSTKRSVSSSRSLNRPKSAFIFRSDSSIHKSQNQQQSDDDVFSSPSSSQRHSTSIRRPSSRGSDGTKYMHHSLRIKKRHVSKFISTSPLLVVQAAPSTISVGSTSSLHDENSNSVLLNTSSTAQISPRILPSPSTIPTTTTALGAIHESVAVVAGAVAVESGKRFNESSRMRFPSVQNRRISGNSELDIPSPPPPSSSSFSSSSAAPVMGSRLSKELEQVQKELTELKKYNPCPVKNSMQRIYQAKQRQKSRETKLELLGGGSVTEEAFLERPSKSDRTDTSSSEGWIGKILWNGAWLK